MATNYHPLTYRVFLLAKHRAKAIGAGVIDARGILLAYYAAVVDDKAEQGLLGARWGEDWFGAVHEKWRAEVQKLVAVELQEGGEQLPFSEDVRALLAEVWTSDKTLSPDILLPRMLDRAKQLALTPLLPLSGAAGSGVGVSPAGATAGRLRDALAAAGRLREHLRGAVIGQDQAVEMFVDAYVHALIRPEEDGPRGVMTLLGPPGVGKTLLAQSFAEFITAECGQKAALLRLDMGGYGGHQNFEGLFGAEAFYKGSKFGVLTGFVDRHPNAVIVLDEVEKAHVNTHNALLAMLDSGFVFDKALDKMVDFRGCWVIATTNLGQDLLGLDDPGAVTINRTAMAADAVDFLARAKRSQYSHGEQMHEPALPAAFVSRLARGGVACLRALSPSKMVDIAKSAFGRPPAGTQFAVEDSAALLFLLSLLPDLDARRLTGRVTAWMSELLSDGVAAAAPAAFKGEVLSVQVRAGQDAAEWLADAARTHRLRVLVIDDDPHIVDLLNCALLASVASLQRLDPQEDPSRALSRIQADVVLLDASIYAADNSPDVSQAMAILDRLRGEFPSVPVVLYSERPEDRAGRLDALDALAAGGGITAYLPLVGSRTELFDEAGFVNRLSGILAALQQDRLVNDLSRRRKSLKFRVQHAEADGALVAEMANPVVQTVTRADDAAAAIRFAGIPAERFADVVGLERAKERLQQVLGWLRAPGTLGAFGVSPPRGYLLAGPPGTGKTLLARAFAGEAGLPFLALAASELRSRWHGESEQRVRDLFAMARRYAPALVFIDEIDEIALSREQYDANGFSGVLNQLLACLDGFHRDDRPVFVLAATNHAQRLDSALLRPGRFDEVVPVELPGRSARRRLFELRFGALGVTGVNIDRLTEGTSGMSPAAIDRIVREAVYATAARGEAMPTDTDFEAARRLVRFGASSRTIEVSPSERRNTAYHEAGHAVAMHHLDPSRRIDFLTILPDERGALGFVAFDDGDEVSSLSYARLRRQMIVAMAGRAGELLIDDTPENLSAGASTDLAQATRLAYLAITRYGFDRGIGPLGIGGAGDSLGSAWAHDVKNAAQRWLNEAQVAAIELLQDRRGEVERVAQALLMAESLTGQELKDLLVEVPSP